MDLYLSGLGEEQRALLQSCDLQLLVQYKSRQCELRIIEDTPSLLFFV